MPCNAFRHLVHLLIGQSHVVINYRNIFRNFRHLLTEQRNDRLRIVIRHIVLIEAIEQRSLLFIEQRNTLQWGIRMADESIRCIAN